jgi:hypothetical protein
VSPIRVDGVVGATQGSDIALARSADDVAPQRDGVDIGVQQCHRVANLRHALRRNELDLDYSDEFVERALVYRP